MVEPFTSLRGRYDVIVADPPWNFQIWSQKGNKKSASRHYKTMTPAEIVSLPVAELAKPDCLLLLWATGCMLPQAFHALVSWGFAFKSEIVWLKMTKRGNHRVGTGYRVRTMHEPILIATRGNPKHAAFPSVLHGLAREHSRKPAEFYRMVRQHTPKQRRCDLFARERHTGFASWGNEIGKFTSTEGVSHRTG